MLWLMFPLGAEVARGFLKKGRELFFQCPYHLHRFEKLKKKKIVNKNTKRKPNYKVQVA